MSDDAIKLAREVVTEHSEAEADMGLLLRETTATVLARAVLSLAAERDQLRAALLDACNCWSANRVIDSALKRTLIERYRKLAEGK